MFDVGVVSGGSNCDAGPRFVTGGSGELVESDLRRGATRRLAITAIASLE